VKLDQIRWDSVAKIGAGVLLAVAIATTVPSLVDSEKPEPLDPDVGLPQAAIPAPVPPAPPPPKPAKKPKPQPKPPKRPRKRHESPKPTYDAPTAPPPVSSPVYIAPAGSAENFGFERP
jgi:protein TonB